MAPRKDVTRSQVGANLEAPQQGENPPPPANPMPEDRLTRLENQVQQLTELLTGYLHQTEQHRSHVPSQRAEHQSPPPAREPRQSRQTGQEIHSSEAAGSTSAPSRERGTSQERRLRFLEKQVHELKKGKEEFNEEALSIDEFDQRIAMVALQNGLRAGPFAQSLAKTPPRTFTEALARANKYINAEEVMKVKRAEQPDRKEREKEKKKPAPEQKTDYRPSRAPDRPSFGGARGSPVNYTPLNTSRAEILLALEDKNYLRRPSPLKSPPNTRSKKKYCRFHRDHGHDTEDCIQLKEEIQELINRGYLRDFVGRGGTVPGSHSTAPKSTVKEGVVITFSEEDLPSYPSYSDPLVITAQVGEWEMRRILVDPGSSSEILYKRAFLGMGFTLDQLRPVRVPLVGFDGMVIHSEGLIRLPLTVGSGSHKSRVTLDFLVADVPSAYNMILGRSGLSALRAVPSTYHMVLKFPTSGGIGKVRGDQRQARECYVASLSATMAKGSELDSRPNREAVPQAGQGQMETEQVRNPSIGAGQRSVREEGQNSAAPPTVVTSFILEGPEEPKTSEPVDELEEVPLGEELGRTVRISAKLQEPLRSEILSLLRRYQDVFAWSTLDMPGIDPAIMTHRLGLYSDCVPVRQRKRKFASERAKAIEAEVEKLMEANHIREVNYPEWLANVVLVSKGSGKWRLCIDFKDLNKACPKDSYPLPRIDALIDGTAGCQLMSFLDAFQGYHQIPLHPEDQEKTAFITDKATYCYRVMPFGLKNAGATYQRLVNKLFKAQLGRNMEAYVDDMLVKSLLAEQHPDDLEECLRTLRQYQMKLNPAKCAFGVTAGKFLGFMVHYRGIEANPSKIKAILEMPPPRSIKEVQRLTGRIAALGRFLSRSAERQLPFFKALTRVQNFAWTEECQEAFEQLKRCLVSPPVLAKPQPGESLYIYLAASDEAVSSVLVREEDKIQKPVYYVSKRLAGAEIRYTPTEKLAYALVISARKLRPYFEAHHIIVLSSQPLRHVLGKPDLSGRMLKWAVELSAFDIDYRPRPAIKAQALADFIVEGTLPDEANEGISQTWTLSVDGSSSVGGSGAGLLLQGPDGQAWPYALHFEFNASNNEAEYEALIAGLRLAEQMGVRDLEVYSDSNLIVQQVTGEFEAREDVMAQYLAIAKDLMARFRIVKINHVPRAQNAVADALSRIAASSFPRNSRAVYMESLPQKSIETEAEQLCVEGVESWMDPIVAHLTKGWLPEEELESRKLKRQAAKFLLVGSDLYKKSFTQPLLKCVGPVEADYILREIHEGICGSHIGARSLSQKALRQGYYWPTMMSDAGHLVQTCERCQKTSNLVHTPAAELTHLASPCPFSRWGVDILGPFPLAAGQNKYLIAAIDYFTKWVEAEPVATITGRRVKQFLWKSIVCRFGIPRVLITDNGTQFEDRSVQEWCRELGIKQHFTSVAHPQANGQVELTNRTILQGLRARVEKADGQWVDELPSILWSYRTTPRTATGECPFTLCYGSEALIPVEIGVRSYRVEHFDPEINE
ncbi:uncharacterized protein LOC127801573 [Diospyros lotus]|uniref:uncharacterized protein LOC127801573 n=1 Tax=Diospyros lotus TaxID=55363 RepID=UPI0022581808|nr:uncharacterized protein LOC127801573 [Diospyros lotus]